MRDCLYGHKVAYLEVNSPQCLTLLLFPVCYARGYQEDVI